MTNLNIPQCSAPLTEREQYQATIPFESETVSRSWREVSLGFILMAITLTGAALAPWWPLKLMLAVLGALAIMRVFVTYHDFMHGTILRNSRLARILFHGFGLFFLTPPSSWKKSHNYHHGHIGQVCDTGIGTYPIITTRMWQASTRAERAQYRLERHPLTVLFGYITIFLISFCVLPLLRDPAGHKDAALSILIHSFFITLLWIIGGFSVVFYAMILPVFLAAALGSYLFFAQHSYQDMKILPADEWKFHRAALTSSSYLHLNKILQWFTGNIGFHHIHHLNVRIPFYRLPETMAAIPALQSPSTTTLAPREIISCFQSSLWDENRQRMVSFREANQIYQ